MGMYALVLSAVEKEKGYWFRYVLLKGECVCVCGGGGKERRGYLIVPVLIINKLLLVSQKPGPVA